MSEEQPHTPETPHAELKNSSAHLETAFRERHQKERRSSLMESIADFVRTVLIVFFLATILRIFVIQPYIVEGVSMYPRFTTNDYLVVEKLSYRFGTPQRGDIIVFKYPNQPQINYVKRIIGLPGEQVKIENNTVTIINSEHPEGIVLDEKIYLSPNVVTSSSSYSSGKPITVTADNYFVMGDNRPSSSDSREWGLLPKANIVGRVAMRAFPLKEFSFIEHARY